MAFAWHQHVVMMPPILESKSDAFIKILNQSSRVPCLVEDIRWLKQMIVQFHLYPDTRILEAEMGFSCQPQQKKSVRDLLKGVAIDDPDQGMDQDLPTDTQSFFYDPKNDRQWMGGFQGRASQGFRHMYFQWHFKSPLMSLHYPLRPLGQAPERVALFAWKAKEWIQRGQLVWGVRLLSWALHYLQDLSQPLNTIQIIHFRWIPWSALFKWPIQEGFSSFQSEVMRIRTNFHLGYEGYVHALLSARPQPSEFESCLVDPERYVTLKFDPMTQQGPLMLALEVVTDASLLASALEKAEGQFLGSSLFKSQVDLSTDPTSLDYVDYSIRPDLSAIRFLVHSLTCQSLARASLSSRRLIEWAFQP